MNNISRGKKQRNFHLGRVIIFLIFIITIIYSLIISIRLLYDNYIYKHIKILANDESFDKRINILLLGFNNISSDLLDTPKHVSTIIILSVEPNDRSLILLGIPRNIKINNVANDGFDKINMAYINEGAELAVQKIENLLNIPINYYMTINWHNFIKVIDALDGIDIYVENNMDYIDPYQNLEIHLTQGFQHLDGPKVGNYVIYRDEEFADIRRIQRQNRFLKTVIAEKFNMQMLLKLPTLFSVINQFIITNMDTITMLKTINSIIMVKQECLHDEILPGNFVLENGQSYWVPDKPKIDSLISEFLF